MPCGSRVPARSSLASATNVIHPRQDRSVNSAEVVIASTLPDVEISDKLRSGRSQGVQPMPRTAQGSGTRVNSRLDTTPRYSDADLEHVLRALFKLRDGDFR